MTEETPKTEELTEEIKEETAEETPRTEETAPETAEGAAESAEAPENAETEAQTEPEAEDGRKKKKPSLAKRIKASGFFGPGTKIMCCLCLLGLAVYIASRFLPGFAEFWTRYPSHWLRFLLAKATGWIPFSLAEALLLCLPLIAVGYIVCSAVSTKRDPSTKNYVRWVRPVVCVILAVAFTFFAGFGPAYGRYKLADNLGLDDEPVSAQDLYITAIDVTLDLQPLLAEITFDSDGASVMPYGYDEMAEIVNAAYEKFADKVDFISHFGSYPKPIALSEPMTYTHIAGVYTFMTGEANVNTNYPDFLNAFTMAHEMSHQRGIAREDEANFTAFLVCIGSEDVYVRYCGYANLLNYLLSSLRSADKELYDSYRRTMLPDEIIGEFNSYSRFFDKYRESTASKVTGAVNDAYLKSQNQKAGSKSYGLMVDLAVAYYKTLAANSN